MGYLSLACAVPIPNAHMGYKELTSGTSGSPDGWAPSSQFTTDRTGGTPVIVDAWQPLQANTTLLGADEDSLTGRAYSIGLKTAASSDTTRYIDSPKSPLGALYGSEQMSAGDYHYYHLAVRMHGAYSGATPPNTGDFRLSLMAVDTADTSYLTLGTYDLTASDFDAGTWASGKRWMHKYAIGFAALTTTGWTGAGTTPARLFVRVTAKANATTGRLYLALADVKVWTLGPLEASGGNANGLAGALEYAYALSRPTQLEATGPAEIAAFTKGRRLGNGDWRTFDPSGGMKKRTWKATFVNLTETDRQKILRAYHYNQGFASNSGTAFGQPRPLALLWNQPEEFDDAGGFQVHVAHFAAKPVFVDYYKAPGWIASTRSALRYQTTLEFVEA